EGHADESIKSATDIAEGARKRGDDDGEAAARDLLVRALLLAGRSRDAATAFERLDELAKATEDRGLVLEVGLTHGKLALARHQRDNGERELRRVEREARINGLAGIRLEAELDLAGDDRALRGHVASEAKRLGFGRIARAAER